MVACADANVERQPNPPPKQKNTLLTLPGNLAKIQPLCPKLELLMCYLSRDPLKAKEFLPKLKAHHTVLEVWYCKPIPNLLQKVEIVLPSMEN